MSTDSSGGRLGRASDSQSEEAAETSIAPDRNDAPSSGDGGVSNQLDANAAQSDAHGGSVADRLAEFEQRSEMGRRTRRRWTGRAFIIVGILLLVGCGWVGWRAYQAYRYLNDAAAEVSALQSDLRSLDSLDTSKAEGTIARLQVASAGAVNATSDPIYQLAVHLPWVGSNLFAVGEVAAVVDGLANEAAPRLLSVADMLEPSLSTTPGSIDLSFFVRSAPELIAADVDVRDAAARVAAIPSGHLVAPVSRAVGELHDKVTSLGRTTEAAARIGRLAPSMLGAQGVRRYLLVFQNLAEPRATGGIFGSYALLTLDNGAFALSGQGSATRDLGKFDPPLSVPSTLPSALYHQLPGTFPTDTNLTPDFPTAAALMARMYSQRTGLAVDGVMALDPIALSHLIEHMKPVDVGRGIRVTSDNLADVLMSQAYELFPEPSDADARDQFLANATRAVFAAVTGSGSGPMALIKAVSRSAQERRLLLWSAHSDEQNSLLATPVSGEFPRSDNPSPQFGMFRNDGTGAKLGYYASGEVELTSAGCTSDGRRTIRLQMTLSYRRPPAKVPDYVLGLQAAGGRVLRTNVLIVAPGDARRASVTIDGRPVQGTSVVGAGQLVDQVTVDLDPGRTASVVATFTIPDGPSFDAVPATTPGVKAWTVEGAAIPSCGG